MTGVPHLPRRSLLNAMAIKSKPSSNRRGLFAGGNWIIDQVKLIDVYPQREQLANIRRQTQGTGGAAYNVLIDLARLGAGFPLMGAGFVGKDDLGQRILDGVVQFVLRHRGLLRPDFERNVRADHGGQLDEPAARVG